MKVHKMSTKQFAKFVTGLQKQAMKNPISISITSTEKFCLKIQDILSKIGVETHLYNTKNENTSTRTLYIWNKDSCKKFLDYIYNDAELYLFRKYNIYINKFYKSA